MRARDWRGREGALAAFDGVVVSWSERVYLDVDRAIDDDDQCELGDDFPIEEML